MPMGIDIAGLYTTMYVVGSAKSQPMRQGDNALAVTLVVVKRLSCPWLCHCSRLSSTHRPSH
jgi:hypothetical protein